jgi:hypothetical protein
VLASLFVLAASSALLMLLAPPVAALPAAAAVFAPLRTALLSSVVVALGAVSRWPKAAAFGRLVYPVLIAGARVYWPTTSCIRGPARSSSRWR